MKKVVESLLSNSIEIQRIKSDSTDIWLALIQKKLKKAENMDPLLNCNKILNHNSWLYFKLYRDPALTNDWKPVLDWYCQTMTAIIRPAITNRNDIKAILFGTYGPEPYVNENERYHRKIETPRQDVSFIRIRVSPTPRYKKALLTAFDTAINQNRNLVWDYEVMLTYDIKTDLGSRFGSNTNSQTLQFIRYWDACCRYILTIIDVQTNWTANVDIWGVSHLINNSMGAWLRPERGPIVCPVCNNHMYMATSARPNQAMNIQATEFPVCLFVCPNCQRIEVRSHNI